MKPTTTEAQLRAWVAEGLTSAQVAKKLGRNAHALRIVFGVLGIGPHSVARALPDMEIIKRLQAGKNPDAVARELGVSRNKVTTAAAHFVANATKAPPLP